MGRYYNIVGYSLRISKGLGLVLFADFLFM